MRRAFVSHSTADDSFVAEMESFLRAAGFDEVFNDVHAIKPDEQFWPRIEQGITDCDTFVVVITAAATNSEWVQREVALARRLGRRVIPVWREDCPLPPDFSDRDVIDFRPRARKERRFHISRIIKYAPAELIGREDETKLLNDAWQRVLRIETGRPHVLTFVALGGEGKTSLVAKWAAGLAAQDWPGCDAAFAWSFYSQGTREQMAASSDLFLKEALNFFAEGDPKEEEIKAFAASPAGAFEKGQRLARLVGARRNLLILDGLEPLQYSPTAPTPGQLKDHGLAALLKGLAAASHGLCVVTTRYSLPDLKAFWPAFPSPSGRGAGGEGTVREVPLLRLSRDAGVHLLKTLGVKGSELRNVPLDANTASEAPKGATHASPGQRPGLASKESSALKQRDKADLAGCAAPSGLDTDAASTQGVALGWPGSGRWPVDSGSRTPGGRELVNEYEKLVEDVKGHALTLTLLGGFLKRAFHGDIRRRDRVKFEKADAQMDGGHAFRTMAAYERWLLRDGGDEGRREVAVLRLMGLFDRPADAGCLAALRRETIPGLTESLTGLADDDWEYCLSGLEAAKLLTVNRDATGALLSLDAHPHLREYFARQLRTQQPDVWRAAHRRLYEHLWHITTEDTMLSLEECHMHALGMDTCQPKLTIDDLQPLYAAVYHGCQAEMQQSAFSDVYFDRIQRRAQFYSSRKLGAFGSDLGALACFFEQTWNRVSPSFKENDQSYLLHQAALCLQSLGRLSEAIEPVRRSLEMSVARQSWGEAATTGNMLSELQLTVGKLDEAISYSEQSIIYADRRDDAFRQAGGKLVSFEAAEIAAQRTCTRSTLANTLHQRGHRTEAETCFLEARKVHAEHHSSDPLFELYSLSRIYAVAPRFLDGIQAWATVQPEG